MDPKNRSLIIILVLLFWASLLLAGPEYFYILIPGWILIFWSMIFFTFPRRRLPEENGLIPLYEERCLAIPYKERLPPLINVSILWGGSIFPARIAFYEDFFVIAMIFMTKAHYSEVVSTSFKKSWLSNHITIRLTNGISLVLKPRNFEKIQSLISKITPA